MALFLLYESASGYALLEAHGIDEIEQNTEAVRNSVTDLNRFGKVIKLRSFNPFTSALDALKQCNAVSEGILTDELRIVLETNLPKVKAGKKSKFSLGVSDPKIGSQISDVTKIPCQCNEFVNELLRGVRLHFDKFVKMKKNKAAAATNGAGMTVDKAPDATETTNGDASEDHKSEKKKKKKEKRKLEQEVELHEADDGTNGVANEKGGAVRKKKKRKKDDDNGEVLEAADETKKKKKKSKSKEMEPEEVHVDVSGKKAKKKKNKAAAAATNGDGMTVDKAPETTNSDASEDHKSEKKKKKKGKMKLEQEVELHEANDGTNEVANEKDGAVKEKKIRKKDDNGVVLEAADDTKKKKKKSKSKEMETEEVHVDVSGKKAKTKKNKAAAATNGDGMTVDKALETTNSDASEDHKSEKKKKKEKRKPEQEVELHEADGGTNGVANEKDGAVKKKKKRKKDDDNGEVLEAADETKKKKKKSKSKEMETEEVPVDVSGEKAKKKKNKAAATANGDEIAVDKAPETTNGDASEDHKSEKKKKKKGNMKLEQEVELHEANDGTNEVANEKDGAVKEKKIRKKDDNGVVLEAADDTKKKKKKSKSKEMETEEVHVDVSGKKAKTKKNKAAAATNGDGMTVDKAPETTNGDVSEDHKSEKKKKKEKRKLEQEVELHEADGGTNGVANEKDGAVKKKKKRKKDDDNGEVLEAADETKKKKKKSKSKEMETEEVPVDVSGEKAKKKKNKAAATTNGDEIAVDKAPETTNGDASEDHKSEKKKKKKGKRKLEQEVELLEADDGTNGVANENYGAVKMKKKSKKDEMDSRDCLASKMSPNRSFTQHAAYLSLCDSLGVDAEVNFKLFQCVWKWKGTQRDRLFLWQLANNILLTNEYRVARQMATDSSCSRCLGLRESVLHVFRDCDFASQVWQGLVPVALWSGFFSLSREDWLLANLSDCKFYWHSIPWSLVFGFALDSLWRVRNELVFENLGSSASAVVSRILTRVQDFNSLCAKPSSGVPVVCGSNAVLPRWFPPWENWIKINTDGAFCSSRKRAACGGVLRDHDGRFLVGFSASLGKCSIVQVELWGIVHGLRIALDRGFSRVYVESDSKLAVNFLRNGVDDTNPSAPLVRMVYRLLNQFSVTYLRHVYREANSVADEFAKNGLSLQEPMQIFEAIPDFGIVPFMFDSCGTWFGRA